jgi:hypothetical protein
VPGLFTAASAAQEHISLVFRASTSRVVSGGGKSLALMPVRPGPIERGLILYFIDFILYDMLFICLFACTLFENNRS